VSAVGGGVGARSPCAVGTQVLGFLTIFSDLGFTSPRGAFVNDFSIDFVSKQSWERLGVEVSYLGQRLFLLNKEHGDDKVEIEFLTDLILLPLKVGMIFPLAEFQAILDEATKELLECG
jgi:hypothetical protein